MIDFLAIIIGINFCTVLVSYFSFFGSFLLSTHSLPLIIKSFFVFLSPRALYHIHLHICIYIYDTLFSFVLNFVDDNLAFDFGLILLLLVFGVVKHIYLEISLSTTLLFWRL